VRRSHDRRIRALHSLNPFAFALFAIHALARAQVFAAREADAFAFLRGAKIRRWVMITASDNPRRSPAGAHRMQEFWQHHHRRQRKSITSLTLFMTSRRSSIYRTRVSASVRAGSR